MKLCINRKLFLAVLLAILLTTPTLAQNPTSISHLTMSQTDVYAAANAPWFFDMVDSDDSYPFDDIGQHVSIALHPVTGRPYISYYQASQQNLRMAKYVVTGGNCGANNDWQCETVDSSGNVGMYSSIAIDPTDNLPVISYFAGELKLAERTVNHWSFTTIHDPNFVSAGMYTSLKIDAAGIPTSLFISLTYLV